MQHEAEVNINDSMQKKYGMGFSGIIYTKMST